MSTVLLSLLHGFAVSLTPMNLIAATIGVIIGTFTGILPGIGVVGTISLLLPFSFGLDAVTAIIMFSGIYYGAMYGGSTTAILVNVPGETGSIVTCLDGYAMARKGRAGAALGIAAIGSFVAGTIGVIGLTFFAPILADAALAFGPPEYLAIGLLGLVVLTNLSGSSPLRSALMICIGMILGTVGMDPMSGIERFTFNIGQLSRGIDFVLVGMGIFGLGEVLATVSEPVNSISLKRVSFRELYPNREELKRSIGPIFRGGIIGFLMGLIPGPATSLSTFASYSIERKISKHPEEFGKGAIEGVAGPESANNAASSAAMVPLLSLGIPFTSASVVILTGFMIHGINPGPTLINSHPDVFWGLIASMYIGNLLLLIINLPLAGVFASLLMTPLNILMPIVVVITLTGAYAINYSIFDLGLLLMFGVLGYFMKKAHYELAPLAVGFFLGPIIEKSLVQSMILCNGKFSALLTRPISGTILGITFALIIFMLIRWLTNVKKKNIVWR